MENSLSSTGCGNVPVQPDSQNILVCNICLVPPSNPVSTFCGHLFCWSCLDHWQQNQPKPCPVCRITLVRRNTNVIFIHGSKEMGSIDGAAGSTDGNQPAASSGSGITQDQPNLLKCHICRMLPTDPVTTSCGHIFCWPCLYRQQQQSRRRTAPCMVCRESVRIEVDVIPIYGSSHVQVDSPGNGADDDGNAAEAGAIPQRPNPRISPLESSGHVWTTPGVVLPGRPDDAVLPLGLQLLSLLSEVSDRIRRIDLLYEEMLEVDAEDPCEPGTEFGS